jgi:periplasmic copper chaperone A
MRFVLLPAALLLIAAGDASTITVTHPWARPSAGAATTGAAYLTLTDTGAADRLTAVSTPVAGTADVHETISDKGMMKMRPVEGGLALTPGKPVTLSPGGYHVMLMGLKAPLKAGDTFPLTLTFQHAPPQTITVIVESPKSAAPAMDHSSMDHDHH